MFIHPGHGKIETGLSPQGLLQALSVAAAMDGLGGGLLGRIEGQSHHEQLDPAVAQQGKQPLQVQFQAGPAQGGQGGHRQTEGITAGQTDSFPAHVEGEGRAGPRCWHSALAQGGGNASATGLQLLQDRTDALGRTEVGLGILTAPEASGHQHHIPLVFGSDLAEPAKPFNVVDRAVKPDLITLGSQAPQKQFGGGAEKVGPTGVHAELHLMSTSGVVGEPAGAGHSFVALHIDQQPAVPLAAIQEILDATVEHLAQRGGTGGLLEVPEKGGGTALQRPQLQGGRQGGGGLFGVPLPSPDPLGALGLKSLLTQHGEAQRVHGGGAGDPAHGPRRLPNGFSQQGGGRAVGGVIVAESKGQPQMLNLPTGAAAIDRPSNDEAQHPGLEALIPRRRDQHHRPHRLSASQGRSQAPGHGQQQVALQQGVERQKGWIVEQGEVPALQVADPHLPLWTGLAGLAGWIRRVPPRLRRRLLRGHRLVPPDVAKVGGWQERGRQGGSGEAELAGRRAVLNGPIRSGSWGGGMGRAR